MSRDLRFRELAEVRRSAGRGEDLRMAGNMLDVVMPGDRPESWPALSAAVGVPVHRRVLAQPGELFVRRAAALVDILAHQVDLERGRHWRHPSVSGRRPGAA